MELSNEVKAMETHEKATAYYKASEQFGYKFLMEVKTIRDEKLFKDLGYEDFEKYVLDHFDFSKNTMNERIQSAVAWGEDYNRALGSYGKTKTHKISQLPEPERKKVIDEGIPTESGKKSIDEATTREIAEYQKRLKQKEDALKQAQSEKEEAKRSEQLAIEQLEREQNREPKVITETIEKEVVPDDYEDLKRMNQSLKNEIEFANKKYLMLEASTRGAKELEQKIRSLENREQSVTQRIEAIERLNYLEKEFEEFFDTKVAPMRFKPITEELYGTNAAQRIRQLVETARHWVEEMECVLPQRDIQYAEIIAED